MKNIYKYHFSRINSTKLISKNNTNKKINNRDSKAIFEKMLYKANKFYKNQFKFINITLNDEQNKKRYDIIISIKNFIINNNISINLLYYIIYLFDILIIRNNKYQLFSALEKIGLGALILYIKFYHENSTNSVIKNKKYKQLYHNRYYSMEEVTKIELLCLKLINYDLTEPSSINFIELFLGDGIIFKSDVNSNKNHIENNDGLNSLKYTLLINLENIMIYSNEYIKYNPFYLSCFVIEFCRNIFYLKKWPEIVCSTYNLLKINNYNEIYNELSSKYKNVLSNIKLNQKNKNINKKETIVSRNDNNNSNFNLNLNFISFNEENKTQCHKYLSYRKYDNSALLEKFSNKNKPIQQNIDTVMKKNNHSTKTRENKEIPNNSKTKNTINKIYTCLFEHYIKSSIRNHNNKSNQNSNIKQKASRFFKNTNNRIIKNNIAKKDENNKDTKSASARAMIGQGNKNKSEKNFYEYRRIKLDKKINSFRRKLKNKVIEISTKEENKTELNNTNNNKKVELPAKKINKNNIKYNYIKSISTKNFNNDNQINYNRYEEEALTKRTKERKISNLISIRKTYKIKQNNCSYNILLNKNSTNENVDKNKEETKEENSDVKVKYNNIIKRKFIHRKLDSENFENENNNVLSKENNDLHILNDKKSHIRMFYKLKNLKHKKDCKSQIF